MRIFKPTYSKPLPEGAKILTRKDGKFAKFKNTRGRTTEARLTKKGDKILYETSHWHISFVDNLSITRELKAFTQEQPSRALADRINELLCCRANRQQPSIELEKWLECLPSRIREKLVEFKLLDAESTVAGKTLTELVDEFGDHLKRKERNPKHIREITGTLKRIFKECGFVTWADISPDRLRD